MSNTNYIVEAIENGIERVKIIVDGVVTMANAKEALEQFYKPKNKRRGYWASAEPYVEQVHGKKNEPDPAVKESKSSEDVLEESNTKKAKKQKNESDESEGVFNIPS